MEYLELRECEYDSKTLVEFFTETGKLVMPQRGTENFISAIGHLDGRINLHNTQTLTKQISEADFWDKYVQLGMGHRAIMDLCMMALKLACENEKVVKDVVNFQWKMHFVDFYNCWNDYQKERSTQVFILWDKPKDANLILVSFRGTEPFDADDWITDFDYSWYDVPKLGKVHMGFLEALGLGNRVNTSTFQEQLFGKNATNAHLESSESSVSFSDSEAHSGSDQSSDSERTTDAGKKKLMTEMTAYYAVKSLHPLPTKKIISTILDLLRWKRWPGKTVDPSFLALYITSRGATIIYMLLNYYSLRPNLCDTI